MKIRTLRTREDLSKASRDLVLLEGHLPMVMTLSKGEEIRSEGQNARHWCMIQDLINLIQTTVENVSEHTGETPFAIMREIASGMPPEHVAFLYVRKPVAAHDILKMICNIPTSTRLGTKEFSRFDEILDATVAEIVGEINAFAAEAA